jgi:hypothetical protein
MAMAPTVRPLAFNLDSLSGLNLPLLFQQLGIAPDMLVALFLRKVAAVQIGNGG